MDNLSQHSHVYEQVVAWGDMDAFGHVNNVIYYRYIESARISYLEGLGIFDFPINVVVAFNQCKYLSPVVYPDILKIMVNIEEVRESGFRMRYMLWSENQQKLVAESEAVIVCISKDNGSKVSLPSKIREKIITRN